MLSRPLFRCRFLRAAWACMAFSGASAAWGQELTGLALTSDAGEDRAYAIDDLVEVTATFDVEVTVEGNPAVRLLIGKEERAAVYWSGQGRELLFRYTVAEGEVDDDGISIGANRLDLNGGSITDGGGNAAALTHEAIENQPDHRVDGVAPVALRLGVISDPGADETYTTGDIIQVGVLFTEPIAAVGTPALPILIGDHQRLAFFAGAALDGAVFAYAVRAEDQDEDGISVEADALLVGGKGITDAAGNPAVLAHEALEAQSGHKVAGVNLPITGIQFVSDAGAHDTYRTGDTVSVEVLFASAVSVLGRPTLRLQVGDDGRTAHYQESAAGGLRFAYTVVKGDLDEDGISIDQNALALSGGRIVDGAGSPVDLRHTAVADQARHMVDAVSPTVAGLAIVSDAGEDGSYRPGDDIEIAVEFSEPVRVVAGSPRLRIRVGDTERFADFAGGDERTLRFRYTFDAEDHDNNGVSVYRNGLVADGAEIRDRVGNPARLAHDALQTQPSHKVDGVVPDVAAVEIRSTSGSDDTYGVGDVIEIRVTFGEPVDVSGTPSIALHVGDEAREARYVEGSGRRAIRFVYTVVEGDTDRNGVSVPANTLALNGGAITDRVGNPASLAHATLPADPAHKVYTLLPSPLETPADLALAVGGLAASVDLAPLFDGAVLAFSALSADPSVATASVEASTLTVAPVREGATMIEVAARNQAGAATVAFAVVVSTSAEERSLLADAFAGVGRSMLSGAADVFDGRFTLAPEGGPPNRFNADGRWHPEAVGLDDGRWGEMAPWTVATGRQPGSGSPLFAGFDQTVGAGGWTAWGAYDRRSFDGEPGDGDYGGYGTAAYLGFERRGGNWLTGLAAGGTRSDVQYDYSGEVHGAGEIAADVYGVYPYFHWGRMGDLQVWLVGGFGLGDMTAKRWHAGGLTDQAALGMSMGLAGMRYRLPWTLLGGTLTARGDGGLLNLDAEDASGVLRELAASVSSARIGVESAWRLGALEPFAELGARYDGGDGETGAGVELAGGVRLRENIAGVGLEAKGRWLAVHSATGFSEGGFSLIASVAPGVRGQGLRLRLAPRWGAPTDRVALAGAGDPFGPVAPLPHTAAWGVDMSVGYGFARREVPALVTPFGELDRTAAGEQRIRLGVRYRIGHASAAASRLEIAAEHVRDERRFAGDRSRIVVTARGAL